MNYTPFNNSGSVECFCVIKAADVKKTAKGVPYLDLVLADKTGETVAKWWDYNDDMPNRFYAGQLVKVRGTINVFNGSEQLRVERIRPIADNDEVDIGDIVPSAEFSGEQMLAALRDTVAVFADEELKTILGAFLDEYEEKLLFWPAAYRLHHAVRGGLLYHTLSILRLAQGICKVYPFVDADLLLAGVILHDICKIEEFEVTDTGLASGYTADGNLVGHLVRGAMAVERIGKALGISEECRMLLEHMILSHHGEPEFGAASRPQFLEAEILSQLDMLDARVFEIAQAVSETLPGEFSQRLWSLDNRKMFNHGRTADTRPKANLMDNQ